MLSPKELAELTLTVTAEEFMDFLNTKATPSDGETAKSLRCNVCQSTEWGLAPYPGGTVRPILTSHPIPFSKGSAVWYFPISCSNCGYTLFFDAQTVTKSVSEGRKS